MKLRNHLLKVGALGIVCILIFTSPIAYAADVIPGCNGGALGSTDVCKDYNSQTQLGTQNPVISDLSIAINILSYVVGISSVIIIIVSALRMVLSNGDANAVSKARGAIIYATVGIIVTVIAQVLVVYVLDKIE